MRERGNQVPVPLFSTDYRSWRCSTAEQELRSRFLEEFLGGRAVTLCALHMGFNPRDLRPQGFDPRLELLDRHGIEVLLAKLHERIAWFVREKIVQIHKRNR